MTSIAHGIIYWMLATHLYAETTEDSFTIESAMFTIKGTQYILHANMTLHFNIEILRALEHGIALQIDTEIQVNRPRKWLWDQTIHKLVLSQRLQYHPLSEQYLVTNTNAMSSRYFPNLRQALKSMQTINDSVFAASSLQKNTKYIAQIRTRLNTKELPTPLKLLASIDSDWRLHSPWVSWTLQ